MVCNNEIPFDNYFTAQTNEEHVHVSEAAANWVTQEIEYGQQGCPVVCATGLTGSASVCANQNVTYTINGTFPANTNLSWNVPAGYQSISQNANSITVKVTSSGTLEAVLSPTLNGVKCSGDVILQKEIAAIPSNFNINFSPGATSDIFIAYITPYAPDFSVNWNFDNVNFTPGNPSETFHYDDADGIIYAQINTPCVSQLKFKLIPMAISSKIALDTVISVFPNPSSINWNVSLPYFYNTVNNLTLFDSRGIKVWQKTTHNKSIIIDNKHLSTGLYLLKVQSDDKIQTMKLIKY